jgi:acyl dehydratase
LEKTMTTTFDSSQSVLAAVGQELGHSEWLTMTQERVNTFADATGDHQWIHIDPVRAAAGPFGACIAHGYLTQSLASYFLPQVIRYEGIKMGVNYGCDKVRFPAAVKVGARLRGRALLTAAQVMPDGCVQSHVRVTIEIEGSERPGCVVDTISRLYFE